MLVIYFKIIAFLFHSALILRTSLNLYKDFIEKTIWQDKPMYIFIVILLGFFVCAWIDYWPPIFTEIIIEYR